MRKFSFLSLQRLIYILLSDTHCYRLRLLLFDAHCCRRYESCHQPDLNIVLSRKILSNNLNSFDTHEPTWQPPSVPQLCNHLYQPLQKKKKLNFLM
ncbi:hypothetical protein C0J52_17313 [Blattella germanica]|nr:hypothetical protein C0J52_17313 [Blattella germanica]